MKRSDVLTIPNLLSVIRIILIPVFVLLYLRAETTGEYAAAAIVIAISGLTDLLDGKIARKLNQVSELGKALDPVADKLTQAAIIFCLMNRYSGMVYLLVLFAIKEISMMVISLLLLHRGKKLDGAMWFGKVSTTVFYVCTFLLIAFPSLPLWLVNSMLVLTGACLLLAFLLYLPQYRKLFQAPEKSA